MTGLAINNTCGDWNRTVIANRAQFFRSARNGPSRPNSESAVEPPPSRVVSPLEGEGAVSQPAPARTWSVRKRAERPAFYAGVSLALTIAGILTVWIANRSFAPEMYGDAMIPVAEAFARGENYAVFDLNINIRKLRDAHIARMTETPDLVILGASQWQEAHVQNFPGKHVYNSHVHRDYWEDVLAVSGMWASHNRLPRQMIITIRDNLFTPVAARSDFLWEPGIPYYRAMADRLGLDKESFWQTMPYHRLRERLSLAMLFENLTRWYNAPEKPHPTAARNFESLDTLLSDGSILWSAGHRRIFTAERSEREAIALADKKRNNPPMVDPAGVKAIDKLLTYLKAQGVEVFLAHPPFNPIFYDRVKDTPYIAGLRQIEQITRDFASAHGLKIIGSFDPREVGCRADMYIDAEHSSIECIGRLLDQYQSLDVQAKMRGSVETD